MHTTLLIHAFTFISPLYFVYHRFFFCFTFIFSLHIIIHLSSFVPNFCFAFCFVSPEFSYRPGLGSVAEGSPSASSPGAAGSAGSGGAPNRPLPPTPDDDESQGDKTLVLRRVSTLHKRGSACVLFYYYFSCNSKFSFFKFTRENLFFLCYFIV